MLFEFHARTLETEISNSQGKKSSSSCANIRRSAKRASIATVIAASFVLCFATPRVTSTEPSKNKTPGAVRILRFPDKYSCGALYFERFNDSDEVQNGIRRYLAPARGNVSVPADSKISLYISYRAALHLQDLDQLKPNDLFKICFDRIDTEEPLDLAPLGHLTGLTDLRFASSNLSDATVAKLAPLKNLIRLHLWWCAIKGTSFGAFVGMHNLKYLNISLNPLAPEAFAALGRMPQVTELDVSKCEVPDAELAQIGKITELTRLDVNGNSAITAKGLQCLRACRKLEFL